MPNKILLDSSHRLTDFGKLQARSNTAIEAMLNHKLDLLEQEGSLLKTIVAELQKQIAQNAALSALGLSLTVDIRCHNKRLKEIDSEMNSIKRYINLNGMNY